VLFAGWLAAQLSWRIERAVGDDALQFVDSSGHKVSIELREQLAGHRRNRSELEIGHRRPRKIRDLLEVSRGKPGEAHAAIDAGGQQRKVSLMSEELMRGGPPCLFARR
jgi:glucose-6-phosphate dehydrogenase assembly protein OpcA